MPRWLLAAPLLAALTACAPTGPLLKRAAFDLGCDRDRLEVVELGANTRGVRGCGRKATYIWSCGKNQSCAWVMNSPRDGE